jgi:hypothetical protein
MSSDYIVGTVTGVLATTFGFGLTMLYERYKNRKWEKKEKNKILSLLSNELVDNLEIANENLKLFSQDMALITEHQGYVSHSPALYYDSGWHIAQANDIYSYVGAEIYQWLADTYVHLTYSNAYITARESFRMSQDQTSNPYPKFLLTHDQNLAKYSKEDIERLSNTIKKIEEIKKPQEKSSYMTTVNRKNPLTKS